MKIDTPMAAAKAAMIGAVTLLVSGCSGSFVSASGPSTGRIVKTGKQSDISGIQLIDVTDGVARRMLATQTTSFFSDSFGDVRAAGMLVGSGDILEVNIWEAPPAALFGGGGAGARLGLGQANATSQVTTLPEQTVGMDGRINIPFAGTVTAAGRGTREIETEIVRRLSGKAHKPQAIVRVVRNSTANVTVVGEVRDSLRLPLTATGERLLDALAAAGGVRQPVGKITIQLTRGDQVQSMPLEQVIADPRQNIVLQRGDVVTALFQPFSFTALGATGRSDEIEFEAKGITLAQALGRIGGLQDSRADARGMFIFRFEDPAAIGIEPGTTVAMTPDGKVPVIYRVDMRNPATFFVAQSFPIRNKDIVYVSNAPLADVQKFVNVISSIVFPIVSLQTATQ